MHVYRTMIAMAAIAAIFPTVAAAQEDRPARRVEAITWSPVEHKLTWSVSEGVVGENGKFESKSKTSYEIDMDAATMTLKEEDRRFSKAEAVNVHALMDLVAKYAAESTVWWEAGKGEPVDKSDKSKVKRDDVHRKRGTPKLDDSEPRRSKMIRISHTK